MFLEIEVWQKAYDPQVENCWSRTLITQDEGQTESPFLPHSPQGVWLGIRPWESFSCTGPGQEAFLLSPALYRLPLEGNSRSQMGPDPTGQNREDKPATTHSPPPSALHLDQFLFSDVAWTFHTPTQVELEGHPGQMDQEGSLGLAGDISVTSFSL